FATKQKNKNEKDFLLFLGYIPFRFYRIGSSFGNDSVWCVNAFRDATQRKTDQANELRCLAATAPQLPPLCSNEDIINVLDDYNYKRHPNVLGIVCLLEPPMPGWTGFVPRSKVTEHGHGVRYHVMAENCYKDFKDCLDRVSHDYCQTLLVTAAKWLPHEVCQRTRPSVCRTYLVCLKPGQAGHIPHIVNVYWRSTHSQGLSTLPPNLPALPPGSWASAIITWSAEVQKRTPSYFLG
uniref:Chromosome 10 open reading frame 82 n=1 Tax=Varanus komodoensis TaxID=61221 RepID=A0A8D2KTX0_VARKO